MKTSRKFNFVFLEFFASSTAEKSQTFSSDSSSSNEYKLANFARQADAEADAATILKKVNISSFNAGAAASSSDLMFHHH